MGLGLGDYNSQWHINDQLIYNKTDFLKFVNLLSIPPLDQINHGNRELLPVMPPTSTIMDIEYQWRSLAEMGAVLGTIRPIFRRVRADKVIKTIHHLDFSQTATINIGRLRHQLFAEIGRHVAFRRDINT